MHFLASTTAVVNPDRFGSISPARLLLLTSRWLMFFSHGSKWKLQRKSSKFRQLHRYLHCRQARVSFPEPGVSGKPKVSAVRSDRCHDAHIPDIAAIRWCAHSDSKHQSAIIQCLLSVLSYLTLLLSRWIVQNTLTLADSFLFLEDFQIFPVRTAHFTGSTDENAPFLLTSKNITRIRCK